MCRLTNVKRLNLQAFTLIELLIVIVIIGILATSLIPRLKGAKSSARDAARIADVLQVQKALELYAGDNNGRYPSTTNIAGCADNVWKDPLTSLVSGSYITNLPYDPMNDGTYCYHYNSAPNPSAYFCNGKTRTAYEYTILLKLEQPNDKLLKATSAANFTHCIAGPTK